MGTELIRCDPDFRNGLTWIMLPDGTVRRAFNVADFAGWTHLGWHSYYAIGRDVVGDMHIDTSFVQVDMDWGALVLAVRHGTWDLQFPLNYAPTCFETLIRGGPLDDHKWRYRTIQQARIGHRRALLKARWVAAQEEPPLPEEPPQGDYDMDYYGTPYS